MVYYTIFFAGVLYFSRAEVYFGNKNLYQSRAICIGVLMWLLMGLRDQTVAGDTVTYVWDFLDHPVQWSGFRTFFTETKEPLFYFTEMLCQKVTSSYTVYLFVTSAMVVFGFNKLLGDYSCDMFLSMLLFCGVGSMYFCMAGLRQAMAIGCTMFAFRYAKERKLVPFLIWCLAAYEFHNSSIVFVFVYFLVLVKPNWKLWIAVAVSLFLGVTRNPIVMTITHYFTTKEYVMDEKGLNYTLFFIQLIFVVFCYVYRSNVNQNENNRDFDMLLMLSFVGLCFQALTPIKGEFFRISSYFSIYLCLAVPRAVASAKEQEIRLIYPIMVVGLLAYLYIFGNVKTYFTCF